MITRNVLVEMLVNLLVLTILVVSTSLMFPRTVEDQNYLNFVRLNLPNVRVLVFVLASIFIVSILCFLKHCTFCLGSNRKSRVLRKLVGSIIEYFKGFYLFSSLVLALSVKPMFINGYQGISIIFGLYAIFFLFASSLVGIIGDYIAKIV